MSDSKTMEPLFARVERLGAELIAALQECEAQGVPLFRHAIQSATTAADTQSMRAWIAERERPKGPIVTITVPSRHDTCSATYTSEIAEVTSASLITRTGERFSRKTGQKTNHRDRFSAGPFIAREEIARVLALKWKPPAKATVST